MKPLAQPDEGSSICEEAPAEGECDLLIANYGDGDAVHICTGDHDSKDRHVCGCDRRWRHGVLGRALLGGLDQLQIQIDERGTLIRQAIAQEGSA